MIDNTHIFIVIRSSSFLHFSSQTENETPVQRNVSDVQYVLSSSLNRMTPDIAVKEKTTQRISSKMFPFDRKVSLRNTQPQAPPGDINFDSKGKLLKYIYELI